MRRWERLPQLSGTRCAADGGLETTLLAGGQVLPLFAAFVLLEQERDKPALQEYYVPYIEMVRARRAQLVLDTPT